MPFSWVECLALPQRGGWPWLSMAATAPNATSLALAPDVAAVAERLAAGRGAVNGTKNGRQASRGAFWRVR